MNFWPAAFWLSVYCAWCWWFPLAEHVDPSEKAMGLFLSWLTPAQKMEFLAYNYFHVIGSNSGMKYRINKAVAPFNVEQWHKGNLVKRLCFVPYGASIPGDIMLAQKIGLETDEKFVLGIANEYHRWAEMAMPADPTQIPVDHPA